MSKALLSSILKDGCIPVFWETKSEKRLVNNITSQIVWGDELVSSEDSEIIEYIWILNCQGNQYGSKLQVLWDATAQVIETDNEAGAHIRCHAESNKVTTINVLYVP